MAQSTEDKKDRVQRVIDSHPFLRDSEVRLLLCHEYKKLQSDPIIRGPEDFQLRMELFVDVLTRLSEHEVRNKMAVVAEHMVMSWREAVEEMTLPEDND